MQASHVPPTPTHPQLDLDRSTATPFPCSFQSKAKKGRKCPLSVCVFVSIHRLLSFCFGPFFSFVLLWRCARAPPSALSRLMFGCLLFSLFPVTQYTPPFHLSPVSSFSPFSCAFAFVSARLCEQVHLCLVCHWECALCHALFPPSSFVDLVFFTFFSSFLQPTCYTSDHVCFPTLYALFLFFLSPPLSLAHTRTLLPLSASHRRRVNAPRR